MDAVRAVSVLMAGTMLMQQPPSPRSGGASLRDDTDLKAALAEAADCGQPHRAALADQLQVLLESASFDDPLAFKNGALRVLGHAVDSDSRLAEMYLHLLQAPVVHQILATRQAVGQIAVDGRSGDWPGEVIMSFSPREGQASRVPLRGFAALRGADTLAVLFEMPEGFDSSSPDAPLLGIDVVKLSSRFGTAEYRVEIDGPKVRVLRSGGEEIPDDPRAPILVGASGRFVELAIPLTRFEPDLRSVAVRGLLVDRKSQKQYALTPYCAGPTGPVSAPLEMLIALAARQPLPAGNTLPVAVALQEGLLQQACHADLAGRLRRDAAAWLEWILDLDARQDLSDLSPPNEHSLAAQLAWTCRYDGHAPIESEAEYEFSVALPETIDSMRRYAHTKGWWGPGRTLDPAALHAALASWIAGFKIFDWPDEAARGSGGEFEDQRPEAYIVRGEKRYLCYRDVGINRLWQMSETGAELKGSARQRAALLRAMSLALGLPAVWMAHASGPHLEWYALTYDAGRKKWLPLAPGQPTWDRARVVLAWGKPWTRPERFGPALDPTGALPAGPAALLLLDGLPQEMTRVQFEGLLAKGIPDEQFARSFLVLRQR